MQRLTTAGAFHALAAGAGPAPPVVWLHGFPDHPETAHELLAELAVDRRVVAPYLRGYAPSPTSGPYDAETHARDVLAIIDDLGAPVDLVGHDWGAAITYVICARYPDRVRRAVTLACPHPRTLLRSLRTPAQLARSWYMALFQLPLSSHVARARDFALVDRLWRAWSPGFVLDAERRAKLHACLAASWPAPVRYYRPQKFPATKIATPLLQLHGARDGCILPPTEADAHRFAQRTLEIVPDVGHFLHLEAPARIAARIRAWLAVALLVALVACGQGREHRETRSSEPAARVAADPGAGSGALGSAAGEPGAAGSAAGERGSASEPPPSGAPIPEHIAPLPPFHTLVPRMKQADAQAALADAGAKLATSAPAKLESAGALYVTPWPDLYGTASYTDGRLTVIAFLSERRETLAPFLAKWGEGGRDTNTFWVDYRWPSSRAGWVASLRLPSEDDDYNLFTPRLAFEASSEPTASHTITDTEKIFPRLGQLVGAPLSAASKLLGPGLRRETADEDEGAPERGAQRQGFASLAVAWSETEWELVLRTGAGERITSAELTGETPDEASRERLFDALRAAYGQPQPVVSRAGRVEIQFLAGRLRAVASEQENGWQIVIAPR